MTVSNGIGKQRWSVLGLRKESAFVMIWGKPCLDHCCHAREGNRRWGWSPGTARDLCGVEGRGTTCGVGVKAASRRWRTRSEQGSWVTVVGPHTGEGGPKWVEDNEWWRGGTLGRPDKNGPTGLGKEKPFPFIKNPFMICKLFQSQFKFEIRTILVAI
jgi:hypothetical protein